MIKNDKIKNRLKIELTGTGYTAYWDGVVIYKEDVKQSDILKTYQNKKWVRRILRANGNVTNYDLRLLYILEVLQWNVEMTTKNFGKKDNKNPITLVDFLGFGKAYIKELANAEMANKNNIPFQIEYKLEDMHNLSSKEKSEFCKTAMEHKYIASVQKKKRKNLKNKPLKIKQKKMKKEKTKPKNKTRFFRRIATAIAAAFTMIGGLFATKAFLNEHNELSQNSNVVLFTFGSAENSEKLGENEKLEKSSDSEKSKEEETNTSQVKANYETTYTETTENGTKFSEAVTTEYTKPWIVDETTKKEIDIETKKIIENNNETQVQTIDNNSSTELFLGQVLENLPNGMQFQEGIDGGRTGYIGNSASPKNGFYVIDYAYENKDGKGITYSGLDGKKIDSEWVHISLINAGSKEEADSIIELCKEENNDKAGNIGNTANKKIEPRGWVKASKLIASLEAEKDGINADRN